MAISCSPSNEVMSGFQISVRFTAYSNSNQLMSRHNLSKSLTAPAGNWITLWSSWLDIRSLSLYVSECIQPIKNFTSNCKRCTNIKLWITFYFLNEAHARLFLWLRRKTIWSNAPTSPKILIKTGFSSRRIQSLSLSWLKGMWGLGHELCHPHPVLKPVWSSQASIHDGMYQMKSLRIEIGVTTPSIETDFQSGCQYTLSYPRTWCSEWHHFSEFEEEDVTDSARDRIQQPLQLE